MLQIIEFTKKCVIASLIFLAIGTTAYLLDIASFKPLLAFYLTFEVIASAVILVKIVRYKLMIKRIEEYFEDDAYYEYYYSEYEGKDEEEDYV